MEMQFSPEVKPQTNRFVADADNYQFLKRHLIAQPEMWKDMSQVAMEYIRKTEKIIRVLDGSSRHRDVVDYDDNLVNQGAPDVVIYLDKSARPVSWLVDKFWKDIADQDVVKPKTKFLNIDRNDQTWKDIDLTESKNPSDVIYDFGRLPKEKILAVRAIFHKGRLSEEKWKDEVTKINSDFDQGKRILIVDEVKSSGRTLMIAQNLLKLAFPTSSISGVYFWNSRYETVPINGQIEQQMTSVPVWYNAKEKYGRGISDKYSFYYNLDENYHDIRFRVGAFVLSTPHIKTTKQEDGKTVVEGRIRDELAISLRQDIDQLHVDYMKFANNNPGFKKE
jgi:hypoxanthine phosphoribosyltransferase